MLTAFPRQQCLPERASLLRLYVKCLACHFMLLKDGHMKISQNFATTLLQVQLSFSALSFFFHLRTAACIPAR